MSTWLYGAPDDRIPLRCAAMAMNPSARATGDDQYGFWVAEKGSISSLHTIGKAVANAATLNNALGTACSLIRYCSPAVQLWLTTADNKIWFCRSEPPEAEVDPRQLEQYSLVKFVRVVRLGLGPTWKPAEIKVHAPDAKHVENREMLASAGIVCELPCTAIALPRSARCLPVQVAGRMSNSQTEATLRGDEPAQDFTGSLRQIIGAHLSEGALNIENAADVAGMSARTLERWLAKDGLTYRKLVGQVRYRTAGRLLLDPGLSIRDIAHDLG